MIKCKILKNCWKVISNTMHYKIDIRTYALLMIPSFSLGLVGFMLGSAVKNQPTHLNRIH